MNTRKIALAVVGLLAAVVSAHAGGWERKLERARSICLIPEQAHEFAASLEVETRKAGTKTQSVTLAKRKDFERFNERLLARLQERFGEKAAFVSEEHSKVKQRGGFEIRKWNVRKIDCDFYVLARIALGGARHTAGYRVGKAGFRKENLNVAPQSPSLSIRLMYKKKPGKKGKKVVLIRKALVGLVENFDVGNTVQENKKTLMGLRALTKLAKGESSLRELQKTAAAPGEFVWSHSRYGESFGAARAEFRRFSSGLRKILLERLDESIDEFMEELEEKL